MEQMTIFTITIIGLLLTVDFLVLSLLFTYFRLYIAEKKKSENKPLTPFEEKLLRYM